MAKAKAATPEIGGVSIRWLDDVAEHDYAAAQAYLSLAVAARKYARTSRQCHEGVAHSDGVART
jgi:hypothetical protein